MPFRCNWFVVLVGAAILSACAGRLEDRGRFEPETESSPVAGGNGGGGAGCFDVPAFFSQKCASAGCHAAERPALGLDLASPGVGARVLSGIAVGCGVPYVDPQSPLDSAIIQKISGTECGEPMPLGGTPLTVAQVGCITEWVVALGGGLGDGSTPSESDGAASDGAVP